MQKFVMIYGAFCSVDHIEQAILVRMPGKSTVLNNVFAYAAKDWNTPATVLI